MASIKLIASAFALGAVLSVGAISPSMAVDMEGDSDTGSDLPPNRPESIPAEWARQVWDAWSDCWSSCRVTTTTHYQNGGHMTYPVSGYCYNGSCDDHFNDGNDDFYRHRSSIPGWPSNADDINYDDFASNWND